MKTPKTLFDKVWDEHVVEKIPDGPQILYIDRHLIHEVTSPQAFAELEIVMFLFSEKKKLRQLPTITYPL